MLGNIPKEWDFFTILNLEKDFFQVEICPAIQSLFAFETSHGNYTYQRLPQGWSSSPGLFHTRVRSVLEGWFVRNYIDDLLTRGKGRREHDNNLSKVLWRLQELGLKVNRPE